MPLLNIIDSRKNRHSWLKVSAVIEPTFQDNSVSGADQAAVIPNPRFVIEEADGIPVSIAVLWAQSIEMDVTLYLYETGSNSGFLLGKTSRALFKNQGIPTDIE